MRGWVGGSVLLLAVGGFAAPVGAQPGRSEVTVMSSSPVNDVVETVVSVPAPLPGSAHPAECDRLSYLRFRSSSGPAVSADADRILIAQPGIFEGAGAFESVARNTVAAAAALGVSIEFWALDRRSNCLEDHAGVAAGLRSGDLDVATGYYFGGREVDGRRFAGYADGERTAWLAGVGLEQTLRDQYDLLRAELPDPAGRRDKVLCGGHSLGGSITGYFAQWDFDADPTTLDDAGFAQCAGYFALDTVVAPGSPGPDLGVDLPTGSATTSPVLRLPAVINPETTNMLALTGLAARLNPDGVDDIVARLPHNPNIDLTLRTLLSADYAAFVTGVPDVRALHATNEAMLGVIMDDNSMPFGFIQASVGFPRGPVRPKTFPQPSPALVAVDDPSAVYGWDDYDAVVPNAFTDPSREVTAIAQLARSLCEQPLDFTEWYYPSRLPADMSSPADPAIAAHLLHPDGIERHPVLTIRAADGLGSVPDLRPGDVFLTVPGYNHLDVLTAAGPEPVSTALATGAPHP
ncbi:MAG TPA: hypothetical protein VIW24_03170 [Aldersonia sp.]